MPKEKGIIDYVSWTGAVQNILKRIEVVPEHVLTSLASTFSFENCKQIVLGFFSSVNVFQNANLILEIKKWLL